MIIATAAVCVTIGSPAAYSQQPKEPSAPPKVELGVVEAAANLVTGGQDPSAPKVIELWVAAAGEPRPALKYRLLPAPSERMPGNAAPYYYRALLHMRNIPKEHWKEYDDKADAWLSSDESKFPKEEVAKWIPASAWHSQLKTAAFREFCDWEFRIQDLRGMDVITFPLQEIQDCRQLARLIRLKAHYEIMDGRWPDAVQTLALGYQLARDVAEAPLIINGLIGLAIAQMMNEELLVLFEHGDANLYWAIASFPQPLIDLAPAMQFEMTMPLQLFPFLKDAETAEHSPDEWRRLIVGCLKGLEQMSSADSSGQWRSWQAELAAAALVTKIYPAAKEELIASGMDRQKVESMPVGQIVAIQTARNTEHAFQQVFKNFLLPYDEASRRLTETEKRLIREGHLGPAAQLRSGLPIANLLLPAVNNVLRAEVRLARDLAALQVIEALRMQAAEGGGKLPASLAEVKVAPAPDDPASGRPFSYKYDAASAAATLEVPSLAGEPVRGSSAKRYVIRLK
jgi:hypothetical protein